jgi:hypothetical protein
VSLLPDRVCLRNEAAQLLIQILWPFQPKMMDVVLTRNRVDAVEDWSIVPMRQDQVTDYFRGLNLDGRE